jgi:hypothetical protein
MIASLESSTVRHRRLWVAAVVMWSLAFSQAAAAAHACSMLISASPGQATAASAQAMPPGCKGMAAQSDSTVNVCQSHCFDGQQSHGQVDVPNASIAPQPALIVRPTEACAPAHFIASSFAPLAAAPPPQLRFSRFLI